MTLIVPTLNTTPFLTTAIDETFNGAFNTSALNNGASPSAPQIPDMGWGGAVPATAGWLHISGTVTATPDTLSVNFQAILLAAALSTTVATTGPVLQPAAVPFDFSIPIGSDTPDIRLAMQSNSFNNTDITFHVVATAQWYTTAPVVQLSQRNGGCNCVPCNNGTGEGLISGGLTFVNCSGTIGPTTFWAPFQYTGPFSGPSGATIWRCQVNPDLIGMFLTASDFDSMGNLINPGGAASTDFYYGLTRQDQLNLGTLQTVVNYTQSWVDVAGTGGSIAVGFLVMGSGADITHNIFPAGGGGGGADYVPDFTVFQGGLFNPAGLAVFSLPVDQRSIGYSTGRGLYVAGIGWNGSHTGVFGDKADSGYYAVTATLPVTPILNSDQTVRLGGLYSPLRLTSSFQPFPPFRHTVSVVGGIPHLVS